MSTDEARTLIPQYIARQLAAAEVAAFERQLSQDAELRAEVDELRDVWEALGSLPLAEPSSSLRTRFYAKLAQNRQRTSSNRPWWMPRWSPSFAPQIAGALALFLIGFYVRGSVGNGGAAEIAQLHSEIRNMREMLAISLLERPSASARLEGISWGKRVDHPDRQVAAALLTALNHDPNVNVRLAAVDALQSLAADASIRGALRDSVSAQQSPLIQVALIDALVQVHAEGAAPQFQKIADNAQFEEGVRGHARWALTQMHLP